MQEEGKESAKSKLQAGPTKLFKRCKQKWERNVIVTKGITAGCDKYANSVQSVAIKKRKQAIGIDLIS